ncbi:MAG: outer membrane protein assembly factor [Thermodesulfovibrionia bacterium]|nr:outer membrane protein assembly factor [Thermodesulfovibrionia bacterium]
MNNINVQCVGIRKVFIFIVLIFAYAWTFAVCPDAGAAINIKVTLEGVEGDIKKNVLAYLGIEQQKKNPDLTPNLAEKLHKKAPDQIRQALQPFGYYNPVIHSELVREDSAWHASYKIDPGKPVVIDTIDISVKGEAAGDENFNKMLEKLPLKKRDVLKHQRYEEAKRMFYNTAARFGYLKAEMIANRVDVYPDKYISAVTLHFNSGPQYYFGEIEFIQDTFDSEFLSRFVLFRRGEPYKLSRLLMLQNSLNNSDYFDSVEITPLIDESENREVPIRITLIPRKRNKYTFGLGYGTDTGIRGSLGWENRRINRTGDRMKADLRLSEIKSSFTTEYIVPLSNPRTDNLVYNAGWLTEDTDTSESEKFFGGVRYNHWRNAWKESMHINYEDEKYDVGDESGHSTLLIPGIGWTRINADNPDTATQASRLFLDIRGAHESLLSDTSFLQFRMQLKYIRRITSLSRLILRGEGGGTLIDKFSELPPSVRFFAGGDNSVRGYAYESLGPEDDEQNVIGGKHLLVGSIEFEHQIINKWSAAVFYDAGNAIDELSDTLKKGAGFGVRWRSPVGPVRIDLGFPLDESDKSWRIHVIIGPDL